MAENENLDDEAAMAAMMEEMGSETDELVGEDDFSEQDALSQDEIDSLLGFDDDVSEVTSGIEALLDRGTDNYEKFPMLEVVFDRFARSISSSLRNFTGENAEVNVENMASLRFEDYMNSVPLPTMISVFQAVEWENVALMTIDSQLVYTLIDILLGGGKQGEAFRVEGRPFTSIEQDIIKNFSRMVLEEMSSAFTPITSISFRMDRLETNPRFAMISRPANPVAVISARIEFDDIGGKVDIVFPYTTLEPVKDMLSQMFAGESFGSDVSWESFLSDELKTTDVTLKARLADKVISLQDLAQLKVGSTLIFDKKPDEDMEISCNGIDIFTGRLGSFENNVAISINKVIEKKNS